MSTPIQIHVAVGSKNPCKVNAVQSAFEATFPEATIVIHTYSVPSGVSDQPFGDAETQQGAKNRARAAYEMACETDGDTPCDFSVGLEGGIEIVAEKEGVDCEGNKTTTTELWCTAWMAVLGKGTSICTSAKHGDSTFVPSLASSQQEIWGLAKTASFRLPQKICDLVLVKKMELGDADDEVFQRVNSKQGEGTVGVLTRSMIDRASYYDHAIKLALIPFLWPEHYVSNN